MSDLPALAARLREEEPSRELDVELWRAFAADGREALHEGDRWLIRTVEYFTAGDAECEYASHRDLPELTSSLDAAVALVRAVDKRFEWQVGLYAVGPRAYLWMRGEDTLTAAAPTPALALCLALVEWRIARGQS